MKLAGRQISSQYKITEFLDEGGMSLVYKGIDTGSNQPVAVKVLKQGVSSSQAEDIIRFRREATTVSKLTHPNLVKVYAVGEYEGLNYIVMELVEGEKLEQYIQKKKGLRIGKILQIIKAITEAIDYAHNAGVVHRDLKPSNILIAEGKRAFKTKVLDFGIAQVMELTQIKDEARIVGTFSYMSPEQSGIIKKPVDERSDLYSLGIMFYQLLTRELPFKGRDVGTILHQQIAMQAVPPRQINRDIPEIIEEIVLKLLKKDPEERYQTAKGLLSDLERYNKGEREFVLGKADRLKKLTYRTRLVCREEEIERLKQLYNHTKEGRGSICLVSGEAGRGKSRLVDELRGYVYEQGGEYIGGKCFAQENKIPYQPFKEALNEYLNRIDKLSAEEKKRRITRMKESLGELGEVICSLNPVMREILGKVPALVALEAERENRRFLMVCAKFFRELGEKERPMVIVLDDLQWADEGTFTLLEEILEDVGKYPVLIIGEYRDNEVGDTHSLVRIIKGAKEKGFALEEIKLGNFDVPRLNRFISRLLLEDEDKTQRLSEYIFNKSKGNPFFSIEIIRQMVAEKALDYKEDHWQVEWDKLKSITISATIVEMLLKRIETLEKEQLDVLSIAAVIGRKFGMELLQTITRRPIEELINLVDEAIELQLLEKSVEERELLFVHDRIKDAFYHKIGEGKKKKLHLKIARVIEKLNRKNIEGVLFDLAHHYTEGGDRDKSLEYSFPAAEKSKEGYANEEAIRYYTLVIDALKGKGQRGREKWIKAKEGLAEVYLVIGMSDEAIHICEEVLPLKESTLDKTRMYRMIGAAYFKKGDFVNSEDNIAQGLILLKEKLPQARGKVIMSAISELFGHWLHRLFPQILLYKKNGAAKVNPKYMEILLNYMTLNYMYILSDLVKFVNTALRMLNLAERNMGKSRELAMSMSVYGCFCMAASLFKKGIYYNKEAVRMRTELQDAWGIAQSLMFTGSAYSWKGDYADSIKHLLDSKERFQRIGDLWELGMLSIVLGTTYFYNAQYDKALESLFAQGKISRKIGDYFGESTAYENIAAAYTETGELDKAEEYARKAVALSSEKGIPFIRCISHTHFGILNLTKGEWDEAIANLEQAKKLYEEKIFLRNYTVLLYPYLAEAYLEKARAQKTDIRNKDKRKIRTACRKALKETSPWANHYGGALRVTGKYYAWAGRKRSAARYFLKSIEHCEKLGRKYELARGYYEYGRLLKEQGNEDAAKANWQKAYDIFREIGAGPYIRRTSELLGIKEPTGETAQERLSDRLKLTSVISVGHHLSSILDLDELLERIMDAAIEVTGAERGYLFLFPEDEEGIFSLTSGAKAVGINREPGELEIKVARNVDRDAFKQEEFGVSKTIIKRVEESRQSILIIDAGGEDEFKNQKSVVKYGLRSILCVPLISKDRMLGLVYLDNRLVGGLFTEEKKELLQTVSVQAAISIENARLYKRAVKDGLTGLYNRIFFENYLLKSEEGARRYNKKLSLMIIDIDNFKQINDSYGHRAGDTVLCSVSKLIMNRLRKSDLAARYGGDEFVVLLSETGKEVAGCVGEDINKMLGEQEVSYESSEGIKKVKITVSIGIAEVEKEDDRLILLEKADKALYKAKEQGRNHVVVWKA
jgi:diguanylate cyclase (GGDEF)-like protein